ncbi:uncharacterized protein E6C27_scaffold219G00280 [Cucumis melo var. makuwa]|uniref:Uncharacterized protein n=1 Tax=Cucumis melo var. makuwa TaxID=1194695 RepID=A0A5A7SQC3_CUCMM|nr:uncharacterized protein E6C27_scaffold219G00280 [Cucumis melo var. makuwa]
MNEVLGKWENHHLQKKKKRKQTLISFSQPSPSPDPTQSVAPSPLATADCLSIRASSLKPNRPSFAIRQPSQVVCRSCVTVEAHAPAASVALSARYPSLFVTLRQPSFKASTRQPRVEPCKHPCRATPTTREPQPSRQAFFKGNCYNLDIRTSLLGKRVLLLNSIEQISRCFLGFTKDQLVPTGSQIARVRERVNSEAEAEVRAKASWRMTRSDRDEP